MKFLIVNGPNLNLLGRREPHIYGSKTFEAFLEELKSRFPAHELAYFQSNHEGALIDRLHLLMDHPVDGLVINLGAFSHYSYALQDALSLLSIPAIEVHISHIYRRENFRHTSVTAPVCKGLITGLGLTGYRLAIEALLEG